MIPSKWQEANTVDTQQNPHSDDSNENLHCPLLPNHVAIYFKLKSILYIFDTQWYLYSFLKHRL